MTDQHKGADDGQEATPCPERPRCPETGTDQQEHGQERPRDQERPVTEAQGWWLVVELGVIALVNLVRLLARRP